VNKAAEMKYWKHSATIFALSFVAIGGFVYYDAIYKADAIKREVADYVETVAHDTDVAMRNKSYGKSTAIISNLFSRARGNTDRFAEYLMKESGRIPKGENEAQEWMQSKFEGFYFSQNDLRDALTASSVMFVSGVKESTNLLARKVEIDFGYAVPDAVRINSSAIDERYAALIARSTTLTQLEWKHYWARLVFGLAAGGVINATLGRIVAIRTPKIGWGSNLLTIISGAIGGLIVDNWLESRAKNDLIAQLNDALSKIEANIIHDVIHPMETQRQQQMVDVRRELGRSLTDHRLSNRPRLIDPRLTRWLEGGA
jgi:hypothetical protein